MKKKEREEEEEKKKKKVRRKSKNRKKEEEKGKTSRHFVSLSTLSQTRITYGVQKQPASSVSSSVLLLLLLLLSATSSVFSTRPIQSHTRNHNSSHSLLSAHNTSTYGAQE